MTPNDSHYHSHIRVAKTDHTWITPMTIATIPKIYSLLWKKLLNSLRQP